MLVGVSVMSEKGLPAPPSCTTVATSVPSLGSPLPALTVQVFLERPNSTSSPCLLDGPTVALLSSGAL